MQESYVGLISPRGLECFWREHEHTARFLDRRLRRERNQSCCGYWAVIDETAAEMVKVLLATGQPLEALLALRCLAGHLGAILPDIPEYESQSHRSSAH